MMIFDPMAKCRMQLKINRFAIHTYLCRYLKVNYNTGPVIVTTFLFNFTAFSLFQFYRRICCEGRGVGSQKSAMQSSAYFNKICTDSISLDRYCSNTTRRPSLVRNLHIDQIITKT
jgi:hypothetical protein